MRERQTGRVHETVMIIARGGKAISWKLTSCYKYNLHKLKVIKLIFGRSQQHAFGWTVIAISKLIWYKRVKNLYNDPNSSTHKASAKENTCQNIRKRRWIDFAKRCMGHDPPLRDTRPCLASEESCYLSSDDPNIKPQVKSSKITCIVNFSIGSMNYSGNLLVICSQAIDELTINKDPLRGKELSEFMDPFPLTNNAKTWSGPLDSFAKVPQQDQGTMCVIQKKTDWGEQRILYQNKKK